MYTLNATAQPEALLRRVSALLDRGHAGAARPLLDAVRRLAPPSPRHAELAARLAMQEGRLEQAQRELDDAIAQWPQHAGLRKLRAEVRRQLENFAEAAVDAAEAVVLDPRDPVAKALLGVLLLEFRRVDDAIACLREAVAAQPANPAFRQAIAAALNAADDPDAALATLTEGITAAPADISLRNAAVLQCVRQRDFTAAIALAEQARLVGVVDACLFGLKGHALSSLGRHEEAAAAYAEALKLGPEDQYVRHLAACTGVVPDAARAPKEYLQAVFDGYSDRFELHLISLGYRVPGVMRSILLEDATVAVTQRIGPVLDLGCGTGLLAVALSDLQLEGWVGVDVSAAMLKHAEAKRLYAELHQCDVVEFLHADARAWPLILAADMLCYFGRLDEVFAAVRVRLTGGGRFVFSCECLQPDASGAITGNGDWLLGRQGRYTHAEYYVRQQAAEAGFVVRRVTPELIRLEADAPVAGFVVILERPRDDG